MYNLYIAYYFMLNYFCQMCILNYYVTIKIMLIIYL